MSTPPVTLNLNSCATPSPGAKTPLERSFSSEVGPDGELGSIPLFSIATEFGAAAFIAIVQPSLANGNGLPPPGQPLPLEAVGLMTGWAGAQAGGSAGAIEVPLAGDEGLCPASDLIAASLGAQFERSPIAHALERLPGAMEMRGPIEFGTATLGGCPADGAAPTLNLGANPVAPLSNLAELPTQARQSCVSDIRLGEANWAEALGERVTVMLKGDQQVARLRLDPPHLGPLELRVALNQDQASVAFVAQHAVVREALEQAIPRLRELLGQQDLQLVAVDVSQGDLASGRGHAETGHRRGAPAAGAAEPSGGPDPATEQAVNARVGRQLVDLFA